MRLHRVARHVQLVRDLGTRAPLQQKRQDLLLAPRQIERPRRPRASGLDGVLPLPIPIDECTQLLDPLPLDVLFPAPCFAQERARGYRASAQNDRERGGCGIAVRLAESQTPHDRSGENDDPIKREQQICPGRLVKVRGMSYGVASGAKRSAHAYENHRRCYDIRHAVFPSHPARLLASLLQLTIACNPDQRRGEINHRCGNATDDDRFGSNRIGHRRRSSPT